MKGCEKMDPYQYINEFSKFGGEGGFKPGLERVEFLLEGLGHPEKDLDIIHVAGTNGKGSTIEILRSIYTRGGYSVGVYTSPHLIRFNERMKVNDQEVTGQDLEDLIEELDPIIEELKGEKIGYPSYFEIVTVLALQYFAKKEVDLVLLEVGLGGRLDATNAITNPLVSVITSIAKEHTEILGDNISDIAREKAGIIKEESPVITAVRKEEALDVIEKIAEKRSAEYINIDDHYNYEIITSTLNGQEFTLKPAPSSSLVDDEDNIVREGKFKVGLLGEYQVRNSVLALAVINKLYDSYPITRDKIRMGLLSAKWPGRLEIVNRRPLIILDGAHNTAGMEKLSQFLKDKIPAGKKVSLIFAVLSDKKIEEMLDHMKNIDHNLQLIITRNYNNRSLSVDELQEKVVKAEIYFRKYDDLREAITSTLSRINSDEVLCICGSLYTVSEAKKILKDNK